MYQAAVDILEDTVCDLATELAPHHGWGNLAFLTASRHGEQLQQRVRWQREHRGGPGDPRRLARQVWDGWRGDVSTYL